MKTLPPETLKDADGENRHRHITKSQHSEDENIEKGLQAIFGDDRSDLHVVHRDGSRLTRFLTRLVLGLALIAILAFGGFFVYTNFFASNAKTKPLIMSVEAPASLRSGDQISVVVKYSNPSRIPLAALEIDVNLPPGFVLSTAQPIPTNEQELIWQIGSLGAHSDGQITLQGLWISAVPSAGNIQTLASYRPSNFNSNFSDIATTVVTTLGSVLTLDVTGPETAGPGQTLTYVAKVTNSGVDMVADSVLVVTLPAGFILASSTPKLDPGADAEWPVGTLASGASTEVTWTGSFAADVSDVQRFGVAVSLPSAPDRLLQAEAQAFTDVLGSDLQTTLVINGNTDKTTTELGDTLRLSLRLDNAGDKDLAETSFWLDFKPDSGVPIIWNAAVLAGGKLTAEGIVFDAKTVGVIKAGEKKTFNLSLPVKDTLSATEVDSWTVSAHVSIGDVTVQTPLFPIGMKATVDLSAAASFYSETGAPIGEGPLPPEVGEATSYRVFWHLNKAVHDLEGISVSAIIPPDVSWSDRVVTSTGNLQFDQTSKTVRWDIYSLPANEEATAEFTVTLVPGREDIGTFVKLLSGSNLNAIDSATDSTVSSDADSITTEILNDTFATGKGTVIE